MMLSLNRASLFRVGNFVRTAQSGADKLQLAVRGSTLRHSCVELSTAHFSETPHPLRAFSSSKRIVFNCTDPLNSLKDRCDRQS